MPRPLLNAPAHPYDPALAAEICERLAAGGMLRVICRDDHMPEPWVVYAWRRANPDFAKAYELAREVGYDVMAEECMDIAEDGSEDWETRTNRAGDTYEVVNREAVGRSKLRVETRLRLLGYWSPKYRQSQNLQLTGANEGPVEVSDAAASARIAALLAKAKTRKDGEDPKPDDASDLV